jgi:hypothetical protein
MIVSSTSSPLWIDSLCDEERNGAVAVVGGDIGAVDVDELGVVDAATVMGRVVGDGDNAGIGGVDVVVEDVVVEDVVVEVVEDVEDVVVEVVVAGVAGVVVGGVAVVVVARGGRMGQRCPLVTSPPY